MPMPLAPGIRISSFMQSTRHELHAHALFRHASTSSDTALAFGGPIPRLVRIQSDFIAVRTDLTLAVRSMRPVADTGPRRP